LLISDKVNFRAKSITRNKNTPFQNDGINTKEDISILNKYVPNNSFQKHRLKTDWTKEEIYIIFIDFTTPQ
jgi:predicted hydrolase (HD superfamily)